MAGFKMPRWLGSSKGFRNATAGGGGLLKINAKVLAQFNPKVLGQRYKYTIDNVVHKASLYIRKVAIRSIRKASPGKSYNKPSKPNTPYKSRATKRGSHRARDIRAVMSPSGMAAYIGTIGQNNAPAPSTHEFGKRVVIKTTTNVYGRRRGRYTKQNSAGMSAYKIRAMNKKRNMYKRRKQAMRMVQTQRTVDYPARPVMAPALKVGMAKIPGMWKGSIYGA